MDCFQKEIFLELSRVASGSPSMFTCNVIMSVCDSSPSLFWSRCSNIPKWTYSPPSIVFTLCEWDVFIKVLEHFGSECLFNILSRLSAAFCVTPHSTTHWRSSSGRSSKLLVSYVSLKKSFSSLKLLRQSVNLSSSSMSLSRSMLLAVLFS